MARAQRNFFETDLSLAETFLDQAKWRYERGDPKNGDWSKQRAEKAIRNVRFFSARSNLLSNDMINALAQRCDELDEILAELERTKYDIRRLTRRLE